MSEAFLVPEQQIIPSYNQTKWFQQDGVTSYTTHTFLPWAISPLLRCLVVNDLLVELARWGCWPLRYVDNIFIVVRGMFVWLLKVLFEGLIEFEDSWCRGAGLSGNPAKMKIIVFIRNYKWNNFSAFQLGGQPLEMKSGANYLGVILDSNLFWRDLLDNAWIKLTVCL